MQWCEQKKKTEIEIIFFAIDLKFYGENNCYTEEKNILKWYDSWKLCFQSTCVCFSVILIKSKWIDV